MTVRYAIEAIDYSKKVMTTHMGRFTAGQKESRPVTALIRRDGDFSLTQG